MAGHMQLKTGFNPDEQYVLLQINEGEKAWGHITLEAPEFDGLIRQLGQLRSMFAEQVAPELDPGSRIEAVPDPRWEVRTSGLEQIPVLLLLRHPGFGWTAFAMPKHEAKALGESLIEASR